MSDDIIEIQLKDKDPVIDLSKTELYRKLSSDACPPEEEKPGGENPVGESIDEEYAKAKKRLEGLGCPADLFIEQTRQIIRSSCVLEEAEYDEETVKTIIVSLAESTENILGRNRSKVAFVTLTNSELSSVHFRITYKIGLRMDTRAAKEKTEEDS